MQFRWIFYFVPWYVSPCFTTILGRIFFKKKIQATQLQDCSQIHRAHEVPKDENAPMPHAHVGTELVYATDRADLEPPFKVRYLGWLRRGCRGKAKRSLVDVMLWGGIHPLGLFYFLLGYTTRLLGNLRGPLPMLCFKGQWHPLIPMIQSPWLLKNPVGLEDSFPAKTKLSGAAMLTLWAIDDWTYLRIISVKDIFVSWLLQHFHLLKLSQNQTL